MIYLNTQCCKTKQNQISTTCIQEILITWFLQNPIHGKWVSWPRRLLQYVSSEGNVTLPSADATELLPQDGRLAMREMT